MKLDKKLSTLNPPLELLKILYFPVIIVFNPPTLLDDSFYFISFTFSFKIFGNIAEMLFQKPSRTDKAIK